MRAIRASVTAAVVLALLLTMAFLHGSMGAQPYPPPVGSLSAEVAPSPTTVGATSTVTATVLDISGNPVSGAEVVFQIASQPGTDAAFANGLTETTAVTDANGVATAILSVGSASGRIIVDIVSGEKASQVTVQVQALALPPTGGPPASEGGGGLTNWQAALIAAGVAVVIGGGVAVVRRRRS